VKNRAKKKKGGKRVLREMKLENHWCNTHELGLLH
jgi:hypothetical protein